MRAWPAGLALALLLTGCGGSDGEPVAVPTTVAPTTTRVPLPVPTLEGSPTTFRTPDGDVGCELQPAYARCDVKRASWKAPKKPSDCGNRWGDAVEVAAGSRATFICWFGPSPLSSTRVLRVGQAIKVGLMTCRALTTGVECSGEGHGFRLGRTAYRLS